MVHFETREQKKKRWELRYKESKMYNAAWEGGGEDIRYSLIIL